MGATGLLASPFNGKPQASLPEFAYACGSPLNEINKARTYISDCHQRKASFQLSLLSVCREKPNPSHRWYRLCFATYAVYSSRGQNGRFRQAEDDGFLMQGSHAAFQTPFQQPAGAVSRKFLRLSHGPQASISPTGPVAC
jgi:hypothetical protein